MGAAEEANRLNEENARLRDEIDKVLRERDLAFGRLENEIKAANQARMAEERARESLDELDATIYECLPSDYDDDSPLDCVEHAADRLRDLAQERDEARAELAALRKRVVEALPYPTDDDSDESRTAEEAIEMAVAERDAAYRSRDLAIKMWDEARAEVERLREMAHDFEAMREDRDAAIARITEVGVMVATNGNALAKEAYRRGAEAMRKACIGYCHKIGFHGLTVDLRALPIPEEP